MKTKKLKGFASLLMALVIALSMLPTAAWGTSPASVTAYVTISAAGNIQVGNGGALMARAPVTVTDLNGNGTIDIDDALAAAHTTYADGSHGYASAVGSYGLAITELWGDTSGAFGYYVNDALALGLTEAINDGDSITAYVYSDQTSWSDNYSYFNTSFITTAKDTDITLTLTAAGWSSSSPLSGAQIVTIDPSTGDKTNISGTITDSNGQATISFASAGTYYVSATSATTIVPPVCVVTVNDTISDADYAAAAKAKLTWNSIKGSNASQGNVTTAPNIPSTIDVGGQSVSVSWACSDTTGALSVSNYYGSWSTYVDRPKSTDVETTLAATLTYGTASDTKDFALTVKAEGVTTSQSVVAYGPLMQGIANNYSDANGSTSAINDSDIPWAMIDMVRYGGTLGESARYTTLKSAGSNSSLPKYILSEIAQGSGAAAPAVVSTDIWSAPSVLLARYAAGVTAYADTDNQSLISTMLTYLNGTASSLDVDTAAAMIPALAKYYSNASVKTAVDSTVTWLSSQQNSDGTWSSYGTSNCESTATVIVALSSLGIDAHTDSRFIKNYKSAVEGLMSFALADNSGFGHKGNVTYNAMATEQGFRALVAYASFKHSGSAYNIYTDATAATVGSPVAAPSISTTYVQGGGSYSSSSVTVSVSVYGDTTGAEHTATHIFAKDKGAGRKWIGSESVTLSNGGNALDAVKRVLSNNGYTVSSQSNYISAVTMPSGTVLAEKSNGANSGWLYLVNDVSPDVGMSDYTLSGGESITLYYTDDYTQESGSEQWSNASKNGSAEKLSADAAAEYVYSSTKNPAFGSVGGEWAVIGLARSGYDVSDSWYAAYYAALEQTAKDSRGVLSDRKYTEYARAVLALTSIGKDPANVAGYDLLAPLGDYDAVMKQGVNGAAWALIALDCGGYDVPACPSAATQATRNMYVSAILASELSGGGFSVSGSGSADADMTAMALTALSNYKDDAKVSAAIDRGLKKLSSMQGDDGCFPGGYSESVSQVIIAISSLGISTDDTRFVKNGVTLLDALGKFAASDGGFMHTASATAVNAMSSEQALCALDAAYRVSAGKTSLFSMTDASSFSGYKDVGSGAWFRASVLSCIKKGIMSGVSADTFAPDTAMDRAMLVTAVYRLAGKPTIYFIRQPDMPFSDTESGKWYSDAMIWASLMGITGGVGNGGFAPEAPASREQIAVMLYRYAQYAELDTAQKGTAIHEYSDCGDISDYAEAAMDWAVNAGVISGRGNLLAPGKKATRAEAAVMIARFCTYYKL